MRDLDQSIAEWRRQMMAGGIQSPQVLDELESHLRDDVDEQMRTGTSAPQAFKLAVQRLGQAAALEGEFEKIGETKGAPERLRENFFVLAGIPNQYLEEPMNTSSPNLEPRWATYLKAAAFLLPAVSLWLLATVFLVPKLEQLCAHAGGQPLPKAIRVMLGLTEHGVLISASIILALVLLEWRFSRWPRYRRAAVGTGTFLLNAAILVSIFTLVVVAILVAPDLMHRAK